MVPLDSEMDSLTPFRGPGGHTQNRGELWPKNMLFPHMQGLPWACYKKTEYLRRRAIQLRNNFGGSGGHSSKPGGVITKKHDFLTYAGPSLGVLESNQWYHWIRNPILQHLLGVRGATVKTGGRYPQKTCFSHICRAFPGRARE